MNHLQVDEEVGDGMVDGGGRGGEKVPFFDLFHDGVYFSDISEGFENFLVL